MEQRGSVAGSSGALVIRLVGDSREIKRLPVGRRPRCLFFALNALKTAVQFKKERIRVDMPGCVCEFTVAQLAAYARRHPAVRSVASWGVRAHRVHGNTFDRRSQNWPGFATA